MIIIICNSKGEVVNNKDIEAEGGKCQCNVHDQIEKAAEMSSTEIKPEAININDGESARTGVEDEKLDVMFMMKNKEMKQVTLMVKVKLLIIKILRQRAENVKVTFMIKTMRQKVQLKWVELTVKLKSLIILMIEKVPG